MICTASGKAQRRWGQQGFDHPAQQTVFQFQEAIDAIGHTAQHLYR